MSQSSYDRRLKPEGKLPTHLNVHTHRGTMQPDRCAAGKWRTDFLTATFRSSVFQYSCRLVLKSYQSCYNKMPPLKNQTSDYCWHPVKGSGQSPTNVGHLVSRFCVMITVIVRGRHTTTKYEYIYTWKKF